MQVLKPGDTAKGPSDMFTGDVYFDVIVKGETPSRVRINSVHFTPGARTAWHKHAVGQYLHVIEGMGVVQEKGSDARLLEAGDTIYTPPDVWHWHGAAKDRFMTHLAIWEAPMSADAPESEWGEHVTDEEYGRQPGIEQ